MIKRIPFIFSPQDKIKKAEVKQLPLLKYNSYASPAGPKLMGGGPDCS